MRRFLILVAIALLAIVSAFVAISIATPRIAAADPVVRSGHDSPRAEMRGHGGGYANRGMQRSWNRGHNQPVVVVRPGHRRRH